MSFLAPLASALGSGAAVSSVAVPAGTFSAAGGLAGATIGAGAATAAGGLSIANVLGLAGSGLSAIGSIQQGNAQASAAKYNAQISRQNAVLARQAAEENERRFRVNSRKQAGAIKAGYGKGGVTLEGSPSDILEEQAFIAELDALTIRQGGRQTAGAYESEARLTLNQGKTQKRQSYYKSASSLLKGGADLYASWPA